MSAEYLDLSAAANRLGMHRRTLGRRLDEYGIPIYADPANKKRRLIRVNDVRSLETPRLIERKPRTLEAVS